MNHAWTPRSGAGWCRAARYANTHGHRPFFDDPGWITGYDHAGGDILDHDGASPNHAVVPNGDAWTDERRGTDPHATTDRDRLANQWHVCCRVIVCAGAQIGILANNRVVPDADGSEVVDSHTVADQAVASHGQKPWEEDLRSWANAAWRFDVGPESP